MIKKFIMVCIVALTTMSAMAQVTVNRGNYSSQQQKETSFSDKDSGFLMKYGVKAGLNSTIMSNGMDFDPGFGMGVGFRVGGFLNLRWGYRTENSSKGSGLWGFQPELIYSNQAVKTDVRNVRMNYIAVPLLLKVYPTTAFSIEVGPEFSYLMATSPSNIAVGGAEIKVGDCKGMNFGLAAGLAYDFETGLSVGARYTYGFTDLAKNLKWKNSNIQITVGYMF